MQLLASQVQSSSRYDSRKIWFSEGPSNQAHPLCIILDGDYYIEKMGALSELENALCQSSIPEMSFLFVSYESPEARQKDYLCDDVFSTFIAEDVVGWAKKRVPSIQQHDHLICGVSLSGLISAYITMTYPHIFSRCLSQSGSFWWNHEWFGHTVRELAPSSSRFWLSVGDQETEEHVSHPPMLYQEVSQVFGVEKAAQILEEVGAQVHFHMYAGGHEPGPWKGELIDAMQWLSML